MPSPDVFIPVQYTRKCTQNIPCRPRLSGTVRHSWPCPSQVRIFSVFSGTVQDIQRIPTIIHVGLGLSIFVQDILGRLYVSPSHSSTCPGQSRMLLHVSITTQEIPECVQDSSVHSYSYPEPSMSVPDCPGQSMVFLPMSGMIWAIPASVQARPYHS